jgi:sialidase-1
MKAVLLSFLMVWPLCTFPQSTKEWLFKNHRDGYPMFRIPTIVFLPNGHIVAICEGRQSLMDHGNIDLVMKTSKDQGKSWGPLKVIWDKGNHTCGNPVPIFDQVSQTLFVVACLDNDKVFVLSSKDFGQTWEEPRDISASVKPTQWAWYATGPVHGIQIQEGPFANRLVVPCNHTLIGSTVHQSHAIFSDDHGQTWKLGENVPESKTDECTLVARTDGTLWMNMRNNDRSLPNRKQCFSRNGGQSWKNSQFDSTLIEPICQGAFLGMSNKAILFSNPHHKRKRKNLQIHLMDPNQSEWTKSIVVHAGKAAYSDMVELDQGSLLILFETGKLLPYGGICMKRIHLDSFQNLSKTKKH